MALLQRSADMVQVGAEPVISVAQQMAFYLSVSEEAIRFDSADDDSCTIEVNGDFLDIFFDPTSSIVTNWLST
jgi:hypothetical protein